MTDQILTAEQLGQIVATPGFLDLVEGSQDLIFVLLERHMRNDYDKSDNLSEADYQSDRKANANAVEHGGRVISWFNVLETRVMIVTYPGDHTTLLLAEEY